MSSSASLRSATLATTGPALAAAAVATVRSRFLGRLAEDVLQRHGGERIGRGRRFGDLRLGEAERLAEFGEKARLGLVAQAVGVAHAHRQFERELPELRRGQGRGCARDRGAFEQHVLVQRRHVDLRVAQRLGHAPDLGALRVALAAVGEGGQQGDGQQGVLVGGVHGQVPERGRSAEDGADHATNNPGNPSDRRRLRFRAASAGSMRPVRVHGDATAGVRERDAAGRPPRAPAAAS